MSVLKPKAIPVVLTVRAVRKRVAAIKKNAWDYEGAHGDEDKLHLEVLLSIAAGTCEDAQKCAKIAASTSKLKFDRYTA